jgi:hypothetical protein
MKVFKALLTICFALLFNVTAIYFVSAAVAMDSYGHVEAINHLEAFKALLFPALGINLLYSFVKHKLPARMQSGLAFMPIQVEIWQDYISKNLFKDDAFIMRAYNADRYVLAGKVVHIPQAGSKPGVTRNRQNLPAAVVVRGDTDVTYAIDEFTSDPVLITNAETIELSYDKIADVLSDHLETLNNTAADWMLYNWIANLSGGGSLPPLIRTTGGARAGVDGQTGNRKIFTKDEIKRARLRFNKQGIAKTGRMALLDSEHMNDLMSDLDLLKRDYANELDIKNGVIVRLFGFDIMERSDVALYNHNGGNPTIKLPGSVVNTTDHKASLFFQQNAVERAIGDIKFFENKQDATYFGDIYSALVRAGGRKRRADAAGTMVCVEDNA